MFMNIIKEIVKNDKFMSFIVSGFSGFLIYISKKEVIFKTITKTIYGSIIGLCGKVFLENGSNNKTSVVNLEEVKNILYKIVDKTNPVGSNMTVQAALEGLKKTEVVSDIVIPVKEIGKNIIETSNNIASAGLLPVYGMGLSWSLVAGFGIYRKVRALSPVFDEKMNGLPVIFNNVMNDEELSKSYLITRLVMGSSKALMSLGLYEWGVIIGLVGVTGLISYGVLKSLTREVKEDLIRQEILNNI